MAPTSPPLVPVQPTTSSSYGTTSTLLAHVYTALASIISIPPRCLSEPSGTLPLKTPQQALVIKARHKPRYYTGVLIPPQPRGALRSPRPDPIIDGLIIIFS